MGEFGPHDLTTGTSHPPFVVSASSADPGSPEWLAFNGVIGGNADLWLGVGGGVDWLQIDVGPSKVLGSYSIAVDLLSGATATRSPKDWEMLGSPDGTTWTTLDTQSNQSSWLSGETRLFICLSLVPPGIAYRYFRLNITSNNGDATYTEVAELYLNEFVNVTSGQLAPHDLVSDNSHPPYVASTSVSDNLVRLYQAWQAFDGKVQPTDHGWIGEGLPNWLQMDIGGPLALSAYSILFSDPNLGPIACSGPKNWEMQGSNDGTTWTLLDSRTELAWTSGQTRSYACALIPGPFRYFRIYVTDNTIPATLTGIGELSLFEYFFGTTPQTITFPPVTSNLLGATSSSGLTIWYELLSGPAILTGVQQIGVYVEGPASFVITGPGVVTVKAYQFGSAVYAAAPTQTQVLNVADFAPHDMTDDATPGPFVISASSEGLSGSYFAWRAFDGQSTGGDPGGWIGTAGVAEWLQVDLGAGNGETLAAYKIAAGEIDFTLVPSEWTLEGSNDGSTWTILDTQTAQTVWPLVLGWYELGFTIASPGTDTFRYFRLNITANNGNATLTEVDELFLYGFVGSGAAPAVQRGNIAFDQIRKADRTGDGVQLVTWTMTPPVTHADAGLAGQIAYDAVDGIFYWCYAPNLWARIGPSGYSKAF